MDYHETTLRNFHDREEAEIAECARLKESGLERLESLARGYLTCPRSIVEAANESNDPDAVLVALAVLATKLDANADQLRDARQTVAHACCYLAYWNLPSNEQDNVTIAERDAIGEKLAEVLP